MRAIKGGVEMKISIGVFAHVDAGKTTFCETLLYNTDTIRRMGRVDHQDSFLDNHQLEQERGITIFSQQAIIQDGATDYYLIDTPGHIDFSPEMERTIRILDYAIIIISAVEGIQGHTHTVWQLLAKHHVPVFFFINKIDRIGASTQRTVTEIETELTPDVLLMSDEAASLQIRTFIAERDEEAFEWYFSGEAQNHNWQHKMRQLVNERRLFACMAGTALHNQGVQEFWNFVRSMLTVYYDNDSALRAQVYKISHDPSGLRFTHFKILRGSVALRTPISYQSNGDMYDQKIGAIRSYNGLKYNDLTEAGAGSIVAVSGLSATYAGQLIGKGEESSIAQMKPTLQSRVICANSDKISDVLAAFRLLEEEEPSLGVVWQTALQQLAIKVMGPIQLEILKRLVFERFALEVDFAPPEILYSETVASTVLGYGHFEPLRHYAEVHLQIRPAARGSGVRFVSECHADTLPLRYQHIIEQTILQSSHRGILTGSPLNDVEIALVNGRAHIKHTSGGDFQKATIIALRQGLEQADNVLMEPYYAFVISVEVDHLGKVIHAIQKASGQFSPPLHQQNRAIIRGACSRCNIP